MKNTYELLLCSELSLRNLGSALFVKVGCCYLALQLLELVRLFAYLFDFATLPLVHDLHLRHFLGELLLHRVEVDRGVILLEDLSVDRVERRGSESHY